MVGECSAATIMNEEDGHRFSPHSVSSILDELRILFHYRDWRLVYLGVDKKKKVEKLYHKSMGREAAREVCRFTV